MAHAGAHRLLTPSEERALGRRIQKGDARAKDELVAHNVRLAVDVAMRFQGRGLDFDDLVAAALEGLARAATKYDPDRSDAKFVTVAWLWIRQSLQRAVARESATIRIPDALVRVRLSAQGNPDATDEELAIRHKLTAKRVRQAKEAAHVTASLDQPAGSGGEEDATLHERVGPAFDDDADEAVWLRELVERLPEDERRVIELTFGLNGYGGLEHGNEEIAALIGVSEDSVKKLHTSALRTLRELTS